MSSIFFLSRGPIFIFFIFFRVKIPHDLGLSVLILLCLSFTFFIFASASATWCMSDLLPVHNNIFDLKMRNVLLYLAWHIVYYSTTV